MSEDPGFLAEVIANPDDDMARLVYADWLEEQGSPQGEFIRLQCELETLSEFDPRYRDVQLRCLELEAEFGKEWAQQFKQDVRNTKFRRGFVETITMTARVFIKNAGAIFDQVPVRWLRLNYVKGTQDLWADCPVLSRVEFLDLSELIIPQEDTAALLDSPHLDHLLGLKVGGDGQDLSVESLHAIASPRIAANLEELDFYGTSGELAKLMKAAEQSIGFPKLKSFHAHQTIDPSEPFSCAPFKQSPLERLVLGQIPSKTAEALAALSLDRIKTLRIEELPIRHISRFSQSGVWNGVESLNLGHSSFSAADSRELFRGNNLSCCRELKFAGSWEVERTTEFFECLADHAPLKDLESLHLSRLKPGQLAIIASSPHLQNLKRLAISSCRLSTEDMAAFRNGPLAGSLIEFHLENAHPTTDGVFAAAAGAFPALVSLTVARGWTGLELHDFNEDLCAFLTDSKFTSLRYLDISFMRLNPETLEFIAECRNFPELRELDFGGNVGSNEAMFAVLESERLPTLQRLSMVSCRGLRRSRKISAKYGDRLKY